MSKKAIVVSAAVIVLISVVLAAAALMLTSAETDGLACVYSDGKKLYAIDLDTVSEPYSLTVESAYGTNTISVEQGRICVSEADCPDGTCVKTGWISDGIIPIICLPHRLEIKIEKQTEFDGVAQ